MAHAPVMPDVTGRVPVPQASPDPTAIASLSDAVAVLRARGEAATRAARAARGGVVALTDAEQHAVALLYRRCGGAILARLGALGFAEDERHGILHELFLSLPERLLRYEHRSDEGLAAWMKLAAVRLGLMALRRERTRRTEALDEAQEPADASVLDEDFVALESRDRVRRAVGQLGEGARQVVVLRAYEERSYAEIAELLGIGENAAQVRYCRALQRLKALLRERE